MTSIMKITLHPIPISRFLYLDRGCRGGGSYILMHHIFITPSKYIKATMDLRNNLIVSY